MKLIVIEGTDRTGKSTLIKKLCEHYNYDNVTIRHFGKPKVTEGTNVKYLQSAIFKFECELVKRIKDIEILENKNYFENVIIWNRSHFGEYIYGQLYRNYTREEAYEIVSNINVILKHVNVDSLHIIHLYGDPEFIIKNEDGQSFGKTVEDKEKELKLFFEIFNRQLVFNINHIKVNDGDSFKSKQEIFNEVLNIIE
ncbi:MAG: hypothetical protein RSE41_05375 [Clostridia bacterium]